MTLLIDVGNSAVKWAWRDGDAALAAERLLHVDCTDLATLLASQWANRGRGPALGCCVGPNRVRAAVDAAAASAGVGAVQWLQSEARRAGAGSLVNGYRVPGQLGSDRWHAMLGAVRLYPGKSLLVVNAGTATTVDCVLAGSDRGAQFIGGCIAPGVRLMCTSLARGAAGLPLADGAPAPFPDDTVSAIATGVADAQAGLVERVWRRFAHTHRVDPSVILAGGDAEQLAVALPAELRPTIEHNLVLHGLAVRAER